MLNTMHFEVQYLCSLFFESGQFVSHLKKPFLDQLTRLSFSLFLKMLISQVGRMASYCNKCHHVAKVSVLEYQLELELVN